MPDQIRRVPDVVVVQNLLVIRGELQSEIEGVFDCGCQWPRPRLPTADLQGIRARLNTRRQKKGLEGWHGGGKVVEARSLRERRIEHG